jgi:hypothetical protein
VPANFGRTQRTVFVTQWMFALDFSDNSAACIHGQFAEREIRPFYGDAPTDFHHIQDCFHDFYRILSDQLNALGLLPGKRVRYEGGAPPGQRSRKHRHISPRLALHHATV